MSKVITLDFETYYDREYSLSKMTTEEYIRDPRFHIICVSVRDVHGEFHVLDGAMGLQLLHENLMALGVGTYPLLCQNTMFDGAILAWKLNIVPPLYLDTMGMGAALIRHETGSTSLKAMAEYFNLPPKGTTVHDMMGRTRKSLSEAEYAAYAEYCQHDTALTFLIYQHLRPLMPSVQLLVIDRLIRMYTQPKLEIDSVVCKEASEINEDSLRLKLRAADITLEDALSNDKFAAILKHYVTVPVKTSLRTGKQASALAKGDTAFAKLASHPNPKVRALIDARLSAKSTIERTRLIAFTGIAERNFNKLPVPLGYWRAITGRLAGMDKINLQNLTRGSVLRRAIVAPKDHVIIAADQAQIEARINACWSEQMDLVADFADGEDVYSRFAEVVYKHPVDKELYPTERFVGKTCILGLGYGMGAQRLHDTLIGKVPSSLDFAQECVDAYRAQYPKIAQNWRVATTMLEIMRDRATFKWGPITVGFEHVLLPNGMKINYPDLTLGANGETMYREKVRSNRVGGAGSFTKMYGAKLVENCTQAMAAAIIMEQMVTLSLRGVHAVLQVHDEIVVVAHKSNVDETKRIMHEVMTKPPKWMPKLPLAVEIKQGATYGDCK